MPYTSKAANESDWVAPGSPASAAEMAARQAATAGDRMAPLRGAGVQVDGRRVGFVLACACVLALGILGTVFLVSGINKNSNINRLHHDGVPVTFTVTSCLGLLGGSGSNAAGYSCQGNFTIDGHTYHAYLPGTAPHGPGDKVPSRTVPGDPALISPDYVIDGERATSGVFIVPIILLGLFVAGVAGMSLILRRRRSSETEAPITDSSADR
jgi:hypothetical protein